MTGDEVIARIQERRHTSLDEREKRHLREALAWMRTSGITVNPDDEDRSTIDTGVDGLLYQAWAVIANAPSPAWDANPEGTPSEWRQAAERWRDRWHGYLDWATNWSP
jgi:hypothetical protein